MTDNAEHVKAMAADELIPAIERGDAVLVDVWARWCGPCRSMLPIVEGIAQERADSLQVVKLEIDNPSTPQNDEWTRQFGIQSVPTFILFKNGTDIAGFAGVATPGEFNRWLDEKLAD